MNDFPQARRALMIYYNAARGKLPVVKDFGEFLEHYRTHRYSDGTFLKHNDFLEELEGALKHSSSRDTSTAMMALAGKTPRGHLPSTQAFFQALGGQVAKLTGREFTTAVAQGVRDTAKVAVAGIGAGVGIYFAIGLAALFAPQILEKLSRAK